MTMVGLRLFEVLQPLLQLPVTTDLEWRKLPSRLLNCTAKSGVHRKQRLCFQTFVEERFDKHAVAGRPHGFVANRSRWCTKRALRRVGWSGDKPALLWVFHHIREEELSRLLEDGIDSLAKELYVPGEPEVFPHLKGDPHAGRNEDSPS